MSTASSLTLGEVVHGALAAGIGGVGAVAGIVILKTDCFTFAVREREFSGMVRNNVITVITSVKTIIERAITVITGLFFVYNNSPWGNFV